MTTIESTHRFVPRLVPLASAVLIAMATLHAPLTPAQQPTPATPTDMVDGFNSLFGKQTDGRAIHAKGIVLEATFTPAHGAASLSRAAHLQGKTIPALVRFSSFAGIPTIADTDGLSTPRGMAIKFRLPDGSETDIVTHSINGFPAPDADEFHRLILALASSGPGVAAPTPADRYLRAHPAAKAFFDNATPPPVSFATIPYYGVNSFEFTNAKGESKFGRYQVVPESGTHYLSKQEIASAGKDYLEAEIVRRLGSGQARFTLQVQLSAPGDAVADPTVVWPDTRATVELGVLTLVRPVADSNASERTLLFTPTAVIDGVAPADPMIAFRGGAYGVSYARRHSSAKSESGPTLTGTFRPLFP